MERSSKEAKGCCFSRLVWETQPKIEDEPWLGQKEIAHVLLLQLWLAIGAIRDPQISWLVMEIKWYHEIRFDFDQFFFFGSFERNYGNSTFVPLSISNHAVNSSSMCSEERNGAIVIPSRQNSAILINFFFIPIEQFKSITLAEFERSSYFDSLVKVNINFD